MIVIPDQVTVIIIYTDQQNVTINDSNRPLVCPGDEHEGEIQEEFELLSHP